MRIRFESVDVYTKQCSVGVNATQLARMGATLANNGVNPATGERVIKAEDIPHILSTIAAEAGLVVIIHNDMDVPFPKQGAPPAYLDQMKALLKRHPDTTIIWAHTGLGRIVRPINDHAANLAVILGDPAYKNVYFDISWDEVAKYVVASPEATKITADLINRFPDRFLFGTDEVAPTSQQSYLRVFYQYQPLWNLLTPEASEKVRKGNFARLFDAARPTVRAWEAAHKGGPQAD
jgi:predicted TIM-barrel fold metal-dependent hydrolase